MTEHLTSHHVHASGRSKNVCTSAVLAHFDIDPSEYHYAEDADTVKSVLRRKGYSVRSRASAVRLKRGRTTIGALRKAIAKIDGDERTRYYVGIVGHAMVLNGKGQTVVDTAPRKRDRRTVCHISIVEGERRGKLTADETRDLIALGREYRRQRGDLDLV
jgi:hypothetical protein